MSFRRLLLAGVAILVFITVATGTVAVYALERATETHERIDREFGADILAIEKLRAQAESLIAARRRFLATNHHQDGDRLARATAQFRQRLHELHERNHDRASIVYLSAIDGAARDYIEATSVPNDDRLLEAFERFELSVSQFVDHQDELFTEQIAGARAATSRQEATVLVTTGLVLVLSIGLAAMVMRRLDSQFRREQAATAHAKREAAARQEVLAVVSHDLRTPLSTIVMGSAVLAETLPAAEVRPQRHVQAIRNAADRMTKLIDELLDTARIDAGTIKLHRTRCDVGDLMSKAVELFQVGNSKSITVRAELPAPDTFVHADPERVLQILNNLIANAVKFTPPGGEVIATAARKGDVVELAITDTGSGIPPEQLAHLFERYWQGEGAHEREARKLRGTLSLGLGLGLPICKSLVEAHGGTIWVEANKGGGSRFCFTLPALGVA